MEKWEDVLKRFWAKVNKKSEHECWEWTASRPGFGYGKFSVKHINIGAHVFSLALKLGRPLNEGMCALHTCDNPGCVNPDHLFEGTKGDNNRDCASKDRISKHQRPVGENHKRAKLTADQVIEIRSLASTKRPFEIAKIFGVTDDNIIAIIKRKSWKHI